MSIFATNDLIAKSSSDSDVLPISAAHRCCDVVLLRLVHLLLLCSHVHILHHLRMLFRVVMLNCSSAASFLCLSTTNRVRLLPRCSSAPLMGAFGRRRNSLRLAADSGTHTLLHGQLSLKRLVVADFVDHHGHCIV